jgi:3-hydroxyisobutyrate dehydrogenase
MVKSVAVIGVGAMGAPIARRILSGGFELTVCDRSDDALRPFADSGVRVTHQPADCSAADLVLILVATSDQLRDVLMGENGITSGLTPQHSPLVGVMSTVSPDTVVDVQRTLAPMGIRVIDSPISGGAVRAEEGRLAVIMGGDASDIEAVTPVMQCLGPELFHCGPVGAAQTIKILNNILGMVNTVTVAEVYRLALDHGLSLDDATRILDVSTGRNWLSATPGEAATSFGTFTASRRSFDSLMAIMRKDRDLGLGLLSGSDGSFPVIEQLVSLVDSLGDETFDNWRVVGASRED